MNRGLWRRWLAAGVLAMAVSACAGGVINTPINGPIASVADQGGWPLGPDQFGSTVVGVAFSGGGMRASAFSYGVLNELDRYVVATDRGPQRMTDMIGLVSGVSGGSVTAAYFGLKGRDGLPTFRSRFLEQNAEQGFDTDVSLGNVLRIINDGGVNDRSKFPKWLDDNLFDGATYADLFARKRPLVWIAASDIYSRVPFVFEPVTFNVLCSDLNKVRLSEAVAASAAVPGLFVPLNVENFGSSCGGHVPQFYQRGATDPTAPATLKASAAALIRYRSDPERFRYVKLLDGGLTDNFGIHSLAVARTNRDRPYMPMTAEQAVRVKRFLFLVVDAGRGPAGDWPKNLASPTGMELAGIVTDVAIDSGVYKGYDYFTTIMNGWQADLKRWRCSLSDDEVLKLRGTLEGWRCADVTFTVGRVSSEDAGPELRAAMDKVPTRFKLDPTTLDTVIETGRLALRNNAVFRRFLRNVPQRTLTVAMEETAPPSR
ncbi:patatin-like phospholipase family protein [Microvirga thermotolerans]|uniref:Patatin-like phospholipase family protein n=1 Tax=Microvirga thermotolerans TaxID=2651334 RepID=A0A5P9JZ92_9HYPH|nr:patatin-like phospholipase family protein [Microvirga thermotolerans]QFU16956.1 patatin-like phospholipase family protein [Microvirga thermotolerans]